MKKSPIRRKSRNKLAILKDKLWIVFSIFIRNRDNFMCVSCGKQGNEAGHYIPKSLSENLRFDERNVNTQCTYCNRWLHGNLTKYAIALRRKYGENILEELDRDRKIHKSWTIKELESLIEKYKVWR